MTMTKKQMDCKKVRGHLVSIEILAMHAKNRLDDGDTKSVAIMLDGIEEDIKTLRKEMEGFTNA